MLAALHALVLYRIVVLDAGFRHCMIAASSFSSYFI